MLTKMKHTWNSYVSESGDSIFQNNYIYRASSKDEHYRMGFWDFPYFVALPLAKLGVNRPQKALEIGVGTGRLAACASMMFDYVYGIDISEEVINKAVDYIKEKDYRNIELTVNDGETIPYPDNIFDLVYSFIVFIHIPSKIIVRKYIDEAYRVLKKGGMVRIQLRYAGRFRPRGKDYSQLNDNWNYTQGCSWTRVEAYSLFKNAGFKILKINRDYRDAWQKQKSKTQLWVTAIKE